MSKPSHMKISYPHIYLSAALALLLGACAQESDPVVPSPVGGLSVEIASHPVVTTRADDDGDTPDDGDDPVNPDDDYKNFDISELIPYTLKFDENTIVQVSQLTRDISPFRSPDLTYDFSYIPGTDATWEDENSYNFAPYFQDDPLEWNKIGEGGSLNGGFALFCMYFPIENQIREVRDENEVINYYVMPDQRTLENLTKSDILGAYHSTPTLFSRIRFRLFHLMTYLRIRLYVPVYDDKKHNGYREGALQYATLDNVTPYFAIDWSAVRSSDTQGPPVSPVDGTGQIFMYQHPLPDGETEHPKRMIKYGDFLPDGYFDQGIEGDYDEVRVYDFSVILPNQKGIKDEDGKESNFTSTDFLNFFFRTNAGGTTRYFFNQALSANTNESTLEMNQGVFQYLQLYVPRVGDQAIFVGGHVNDWSNNGTNMMLQPTEVK